MVDKDRRFVMMGAGAAASMLAATAELQSAEPDFGRTYDFVIVGAGSAGLPAAIFAARRGMQVALVDAASEVGGTLHLSGGQVSAAGTLTQIAKGIVDTTDSHYADCMELSRGKADPAIVRRAVDEAPATINWLLRAGLVPLPDHPLTGESPGRPAYTTPRYLWGAEDGRSILAVIRRELEREMPLGRISLMLNSRVSEFTVDRKGGVTGVIVESPQGKRRVRGRRTLLTSGGYAMNPQMFLELSGCPAYTATSWPQSRGDGLRLAQSVGGFLRGQDLHRAGTGSILSRFEYPAKVYARAETTPQRRLPWEIWINDRGERFVCEDEPSTYLRERALVAQPASRYRIVFDQAILESAPALITGWSTEKLLAHFDTHPMFDRADTLDQLAVRCGIDPQSLRKTVDRYNAAVGSGGDEFGRRHCPRRLEKGPFYSVTHFGHSATSSAGVMVDADLRVLRKDGSEVRNLFAAGEVLGSGATLGDAFIPGMLLTPAMALGRWFGATTEG